MVTTEERAGWLARADAAAVTSLADEVLAVTEVSVVHPPEVGVLPMQVREPVALHRWLLADVLATRATVAIGDDLGWGMRLGDDRAAALAAAVCDVAAATGHDLAPRVDELCRRTAADHLRRRHTEAAELAPTIVTFEELDS